MKCTCNVKFSRSIPQAMGMSVLLFSLLGDVVSSFSHLENQEKVYPIAGLRSLLFRQMRQEISGSTQRWVGMQSKHDGNKINSMDCNFTVPLNASIKQFPMKGTGQCHYIYCDLHHRWPSGVFSQFVPQLMRGLCVFENDSSYNIKDKWLDQWYIQSQYIWSTTEGRVKGYIGKLLPVSPGEHVHTRIYFGKDQQGVASYCLQISTSSGPTSQLVITVPFMGTNPQYNAPYGSGQETSDYYEFFLGDLHEAWNMNTPGFYPTAMKWDVTYNAHDGTDARQSVQNTCADKNLLSCSNDVMKVNISLNEPNDVHFYVNRA